MTLTILSIITFLVYFATPLYHATRVITKSPSNVWVWWLGSTLALLGHGWLLWAWIETPFGQNLSLPTLLSLTTWLMGLGLLTFSIRKPLQSLGLLLYPIAALSLFLVSLYPEQAIIDTSTHLGVLSHILISMLAVSICAFAALQACFLGVQHFLLKKHHTSPFLRLLPPLQTMEGTLFLLIWAGFLLLTISLISGLIYFEDFLTWSLYPKSLLSILAWGVLGILLLGRTLLGWRGRIAVRWTLSSFILLILAYFGTKALF